jgi:purine nucleosidase
VTQSLRGLFCCEHFTRRVCPAEVGRGLGPALCHRSRLTLRGETMRGLAGSLRSKPSLGGSKTTPYWFALARRWALLGVVATATVFAAEPRHRKVILDEDVGAASDSNLQALALLLQAPEVDLVGVTVVAGDGPLEPATKQVTALLEAAGRTNVAVAEGAAAPLVNTRGELKQWEEKFGRRSWKGMWNDETAPKATSPKDASEGEATGHPRVVVATEAAAEFMVRQVRAQPGEITLIALGPLTNLALACALDPGFSANVRELVIATGTFDRKTRTLVGSNFNSYFDPEASRIVYRHPWKSVLAVSPESFDNIIITPAMEQAVAGSQTNLTRHLLRTPNPSRKYPMWDEAAVILWLDPSIATISFERYVDIELDRGAGYGRIEMWPEGQQPGFGEPRARVVIDIDQERFNRRFVELMTAPARE